MVWKWYSGCPLIFIFMTIGKIHFLTFLLVAKKLYVFFHKRTCGMGCIPNPMTQTQFLTHQFL